MRPISYTRATDIASAIATVSADPQRAFLAGGTTEIDLLRLNVVQPDDLVDINGLPLKQKDPWDFLVVRRVAEDHRRFLLLIDSNHNTVDVWHRSFLVCSASSGISSGACSASGTTLRITGS